MAKKFFICMMLFGLSIGVAHAELSANPWLEENDEEDLREVYTKRQKRANLKNGIAAYTPEAGTVIDRSHAYIELPKQNDDDKVFLDNILGSGDDDSDASLVPNTLDNRQALAELQHKELSAKSGTDNGSMPDFGISRGINKLKNMVTLPKLPSSTSMIQKFERASGIDLKAIGRQMRR